jgi:hypothetical protein
MSVTFVKQHTPDDFAAILTDLQTRPLPVNHDRMVAGKGKSQAFGVIRRWSYRPWLSRNTWQRPELWAALQSFAQQHVTIPWDAVQVNDNYASNPHKDKGNRGLSYIVGFGDYTGGELSVVDTEYDIRHRGHHFNGSELLHWTQPWAGQRYSLVFFCIEWPTKFQPGYTVTSRLVADGTEITDGYNDSILVVDRKGHLVRTVEAGRRMPWRGRLTEKGQPSRLSDDSET